MITECDLETTLNTLQKIIDSTEKHESYAVNFIDLIEEAMSQISPDPKDYPE